MLRSIASAAEPLLPHAFRTPHPLWHEIDVLLESQLPAEQDIGFDRLLAPNEPGQVLVRLRQLQPRHAPRLLEWLLNVSAPGRLGKLISPAEEELSLCAQIVLTSTISPLQLLPLYSSESEAFKGRLSMALILARSPNSSHWLAAKEVLRPIIQNCTLEEGSDPTSKSKNQLHDLLTLCKNSPDPKLHLNLLETVLQISGLLLEPYEITHHLSCLTKPPSLLRLAAPAALTHNLAKCGFTEINLMNSITRLSMETAWKHGSSASYALERALQNRAYSNYWKIIYKCTPSRVLASLITDSNPYFQYMHPSWPGAASWSREAHQSYCDALLDLCLAHALLVGRTAAFDWNLKWQPKHANDLTLLQAACRDWMVEAGFPIPQNTLPVAPKRTPLTALSLLFGVEAYASHLDIAQRCLQSAKVPLKGHELQRNSKTQEACEEFSEAFTRLSQEKEFLHLLDLCEPSDARRKIPYLLERCQLLAETWKPLKIREGESLSESASRELAVYHPTGPRSRYTNSFATTRLYQWLYGKPYYVDPHDRVRLHNTRLHQWLFCEPQASLKEKLKLLEVATARLWGLFGKDPPRLALWDGYCDRALHAMKINANPALLRTLLHQAVMVLKDPENSGLHEHRAFLEEWQERVPQTVSRHPIQFAAHRTMLHELSKTQLMPAPWVRNTLRRLKP